MKVKIGDKWYSGNEVRICVSYTKHDLDVLKSMIVADCKRYCAYPDSDPASDDDIREWMTDESGQPPTHGEPVIEKFGKARATIVIDDAKPAKHESIMKPMAYINGQLIPINDMDEVPRKEQSLQNIGGIPYNPEAKKTDPDFNYATDRVDISE